MRQLPHLPHCGYGPAILEFKNDFDETRLKSLKCYYSSHSKHDYLIEKTSKSA